MCVKILGMLSPSATLLPLSTFTEEKHYDVVTHFIVNISKLASDRWIFFYLEHLSCSHIFSETMAP